MCTELKDYRFNVREKAIPYFYALMEFAGYKSTDLGYHNYEVKNITQADREKIALFILRCNFVFDSLAERSDHKFCFDSEVCLNVFMSYLRDLGFDYVVDEIGCMDLGFNCILTVQNIGSEEYIGLLGILQKFNLGKVR